ncbi:MAG: TonB family protein [Bacteroidales bacterium]|nr:TonB family protein [Bacteroidales bacterium]
MYIRNLLLTAMAMCAFGMMVACNPSPQDKQPTDSPVFGITEVGAELYVVAEHEPEFPGGIDSLYYFLNKNIRYPEEAIKRKIEGKIYTRFIVEKDGSITNAEIIRDIVYGNEEADSLAVRLGCGAEVIRVINMMPKWKPASDCGTIVRYQFILPVMFSLSEGIINPLSM